MATCPPLGTATDTSPKNGPPRRPHRHLTELDAHTGLHLGSSRRRTLDARGPVPGELGGRERREEAQRDVAHVAVSHEREYEVLTGGWHAQRPEREKQEPGDRAVAGDVVPNQKHGDGRAREELQPLDDRALQVRGPSRARPFREKISCSRRTDCSAPWTRIGITPSSESR